MAKMSEAAQRFVKRRMHTWGEGGMHSRSKGGPVVESSGQAKAIALNEARKKGMEVPNV